MIDSTSCLGLGGQRATSKAENTNSHSTIDDGFGVSRMLTRSAEAGSTSRPLCACEIVQADAESAAHVEDARGLRGS